jgi:hypothetical protein
MQSIGSTYVRPTAPVGSVILGNESSLVPRTEILPKTTYRSTAAAALRNARLADPQKFFNSPLRTNALDVMPSPATAVVLNDVTFDGDGMLMGVGGDVSYPGNLAENLKLRSSQYAAVDIKYRVRFRNLSVVPAETMPLRVPLFTIFTASGHTGFSTGLNGAIQISDFAGGVLNPSPTLGVIPNDCVLTIFIQKGAGLLQLLIDDVVVYTSPTNARYDCGVFLGLNSFSALTSIKFSDLRLERPPDITNGLALTEGTVIPAIAGSVEISDGSALWSLTATIPRADYDAMRSGPQPPVVTLDLGNKKWAFLVDEMTAPRAFAETDVSIRGVSLAALADAPYEFSRQWTSDAPTTAAQIATLAQTYTELDVSWWVPDWSVGVGAWSFQGTPWGVVLQVASSVSAVVEAHALDFSVQVSQRYPVLPNEWAAFPPDAQIPWQAVVSENVVASDQPPYTSAFVAGPSESAASVRLAGTSGADQAPMVTHELLTDLDGQIERARSVLGASGGGQTVTRTIQVLTGAGEPGVLFRGAIIRWVDPAETWTGMVRGVQITWSFGEVSMALSCERRISFPQGTFT